MSFRSSAWAGAAFCAFASVAAAQSTVTAYGVVDVPITYGDGSLTSRKSLGATGGGGLLGSRLGFRGSEDLGGGLKANFVIEHGFTPDTGAQAAAATFWNRQVWVGMSGGFGSVQLGRIYTPTFIVHSNNDPFLTSGVVAQHVLGGSLEAAQAAGVRGNNAVNYQTPATLGGFLVQGMVSAGEGGPGAYQGIRLGYAGGGLGADLSFGRFERSSFGTTALGTVRSFTIGGRYKFGSFTVFGLYDRADSDVLDSQGAQVGVSYVFGATELKASIAQTDLETDSGTDLGTSRRVGIGAVYNLSPRTALYTAIAHVTNKHGARLALNGSTTAANRGSSGIDLGIRHSF